MRSPGRRIIGTALVASLALAAPAQQDPEAGAGELFVDRIEVHVVNVDVAVTDRQGNPVLDLTRDDFEIFEDGKPVPVSNFAVVRQHRRLDAATVAGAGEGAPAPPEPPEPVEPAAAEPVSLVLFVDNSNLGGASRNRVFRRLRGFLGRAVDLQSQVMLATYDNNLKIRQRFTSDPARLEEALAEMEKQPAMVSSSDIERQRVIREIEGVRLQGDVTEIEYAARAVLSSIELYSEQERSRNLRMIETLGRFTDSLAGIPGRKALVLVSEGIQTRPGETLFYSWERKFGSFGFAGSSAAGFQARLGVYDLSGELAELIARSSANKVAFYPLNAAIARGASAVSADAGTLDLSALGSPGGGLSSTPELAAVRSADLDDSLRFLAQGTGGLTFSTDGDTEAVLDRVGDDLANYYALGYMPTRDRDEKIHKIEVKVKRPGLVVRHLSRYKDTSPDDQLTDLTLSALLLDEEENPLAVRLEIDGQQKVKKNYRVTMMVKVPISSMVLLPAAEHHAGHLSMFIIAQDEDGALSPPRKIPLPIKIPRERLREALEQVAGYRMELLMRPGRQRIAVGVRDDLSAVSSTVKLDLHVGGG